MQTASPAPVIRNSPYRLQMQAGPSDRRGKAIAAPQVPSSPSTPLRSSQRAALSALRDVGGQVIDLKEIVIDGQSVDGRLVRGLEKRGLVRKAGSGWSMTHDGYRALNAPEEMAAPVEHAEVSPKGMSAQHFERRARNVLGGWGWQGRFARGLGVNQNTVSRWASGGQEVPEFARATIELLEMIQQAGMTLPERFT
jgi:hypothetical protein